MLPHANAYAYKDPPGWETYTIERGTRGLRAEVYGKLDGQLGMRPVAEEPLDAEARLQMGVGGVDGWGGQD